MKSLLTILLVVFASTVAVGQDHRVKFLGSYTQVQLSADEGTNNRRDKGQLNGALGTAELRIFTVGSFDVSAVVEGMGVFGRTSVSAPINGIPGDARAVASNSTRLHTLNLGPQLSRRFGNVTVFGRGLAGVARLSGAPGQAIDDFSAVVGGGIDVHPSKHLVIRVLSADYFVTGFGPFNQLKPFTTGPARQDSLRLSVGAGFQF